MAQDWTQGICNERSGFLFSHECGGAASNECRVCRKPICHDHSHMDDQGHVCTTCAKEQLKETRTTGQERRYAGGRNEWRDDPYFYSGYYYSGYGYYGPGYWGHGYHAAAHHHDPHDFTEGDAASLAEQYEEDFESDMGES